jgi:uncharacterized protein (DUF362 family)
VTPSHNQFTRRTFLSRAAAFAAAGSVPWSRLAAYAEPPTAARPRVVLARDEKLAQGKLADHRELLEKLLNAALQQLTGAADAASAWRQLFKPSERIGIKVNTLGLFTQPPVVDAVVAGLRLAGVPAEQIIVWDRFDTELGKAGFQLNKSGRGVQCRGTDSKRAGKGYQDTVESSGRIGSCFSKIVAEDIDALISVPVLKDHNTAGVSLGMKNFYGAIHNPNKYHDNNCDPYIVDVVAHRFIAPKWRLTVCDGVRGQCQGGPGPQPGFQWPFAGLIVGADFVATDAVGADVLAAQRKTQGLKSLADDGRPPKYIATAAARGLGVADLTKIERVDV